MRISTASSFDTGIDTLQKRQSALANAQERLASGKRVARASDDPAAAARAEHALASVLRSDTNQRAVDASRAAIEQTEGALGDAGELLQQAREALVAAGNPSYDDHQRAALAAQLKAIRDQLFAVANRGDGAGSYLFGGQGATQKPFVDAPGGVRFVASPGQLSTEQTTALPLTTDGSAVWLAAPTGNGVFQTRPAPGVSGAYIDGGQVSDATLLTGADYTLEFSVAGGSTTYAILKNGAPMAVTAGPYVSGQAIDFDGITLSVSGTPADGDRFDVVPSTPTLSVFDALDKAVTDLAAPGLTGAQRAQSTADNLRNVDSVMGRMQSARSLAGAVLNRIDSETDRLAAQKLAARTEQSAAEDLDMVQSISDFQSRQTGYDAALKSYSMVQRLSLFQYLGG